MVSPLRFLDATQVEDKFDLDYISMNEENKDIYGIIITEISFIDKSLDL